MDLNLISKLIVVLVILICVTFVASKPQEFYKFRLPNIEITSLRYLEEKQSTDLLSAIDAKADIKRVFPDGTFPYTYHFFVLRYNGSIIIFSTLSSPSEIKKLLKKVNVEPIAVDRILLTHIHKDQIGGLCENGKPVFENATIYISEQEARWADGEFNNMIAPTDDNLESQKQAQEIFKIYGARIKRMPNSGEPIFDNVYPMPSYGHTPGHTVYRFELEDKTIVFTGDTFFASEQLQNPGIYLAKGDNADFDPKMAYNSRQDLIDYLASDNIIFFSRRFTFPGIGTFDQRHNFKTWNR